MKKIIVAIAMLFLFSSQAHAAWMNVEIGQIVPFSDGYVHLSVINSSSTQTCNYWGYEFRFDATTPGGDKMYKTLMTAKAMNATVDIGFTPSSMPGTTHTNGCEVDDMAILVFVVF